MKNTLLFILLFLFSAFCSKAQCPTVAISGTDVTCFGGSTGTASVTVSAGSGNYSYTWNNGNNSNSISGLTAGVYSVNVTDLTFGCTVFNVYVVNQPDQLTSSITQQNVNCFGLSTGSIDLTVSGGTAPFSYTWSNSAISQDLSLLPAGTYSVTITDLGGCSATNTTTITQTSSIVNSTVDAQNANCPFSSDGSVNLTTFGGQPPYTFSWNNGTYLSEDINGLTSGQYNVVITDALGCTANNGIFISQPTAITSTITGVPVNCFGGADGSVNLTPAGGTPPYSYTWTSSSFTLGSTEDLINVMADNYHVTITDAHGCTGINNFTVNEPTQLASTITGTNVTCYGYSNGAVSLIVNGGSAPYTFNWTNSLGTFNSTLQNLSNIPAETYIVTITDFHGCVATNSIVISQPLLPLSSIIAGTNAKCFGSNDGTADLTVDGGTIPYSYNWINGDTAEDEQNLFAGNYSVTVLDNNGCVSTSSVVIQQPLAPLSSSSVVTNVTCFGMENGSINYTVNGGTLPYSYSWINSHVALSAVSQDLFNFPAETYVLTVTDSNNCILIDTSIITQPPLLQTSIVSVNVNCFGNATGSIDLTVTGGTPGYVYNWTNGSVSEDLNNLIAGNYFVTVTDTNGCVKTDSAKITQPAAPLSSSNFVKSTTCYGFNDGYIFYNVQGGTLPYTYSWSNGDTTTNIFDLTAGQYISTTTDGNGCLIIDSLTVNQPAQVVITATATPVTCYGLSNGSITISTTGGTVPYSYLWMNSTFVLSSNSQNLVNYPADTYNVTVTDSLGCTGTGIGISIQQPDELVATLIAHNITCHGGTDGHISIDISGGVTPYVSFWSNGDTTEDLIDTPAGVYTDSISDANHCSVVNTYTLVEPPAINVALNIQEVSCADEHDGTVLATVTGGMGEFSYLWSNTSTVNPVLDLKGGEYKLTVTDSLGCKKDSSFIMPVNPIECIVIPNTFTPNADGKNDEWQIHKLELYPECELKIFNRWGELLFKSDKGYTEHWDGNFKGHRLPSETYYYILDLGTGSKPHTGSVTLIY